MTVMKMRLLFFALLHTLLRQFSSSQSHSQRDGRASSVFRVDLTVRRVDLAARRVD